MPRRIDNFTSYFHRKKRDLYFVTFTQVKKDPMGFPAAPMTKTSRFTFTKVKAALRYRTKTSPAR